MYKIKILFTSIKRTFVKIYIFLKFIEKKRLELMERSVWGKF
jgi:hypothetical protein